MTAASRLDAALVVGGLWHDMDFARLELLKKLIVHEDVKTGVFDSYEHPSIAHADFLVSYTCDVTPSSAAVKALKAWLSNGGRWLALHATNSVIRFLSDGRVDTPNTAPEFFELLASRFCAHPPISAYRVDVRAPDHPLVRGIESFDTTDEHYLLETQGDLQVLLDSTFEGRTPRFVRSEWAAARHPVFYIHRVGKGEILYLTLGHCRGPYDMAPLAGERRPVSRCSWELPVFHELVTRAVQWVKSGGGVPG